jgi:hypothetical protein
MFILPALIAIANSPYGLRTKRDTHEDAIKTWMVIRRDRIVAKGGIPTEASLLKGTADPEFRNTCREVGISNKDIVEMARQVLQKTLWFYDYSVS